MRPWSAPRWLNSTEAFCFLLTIGLRRSSRSRGDLDQVAGLSSAITLRPTCYWALRIFSRTARLKALSNANRRCRWIEIWPTPMAGLAIGKYFLGRAAETEAHVHEALRLSPRDIFVYRWMMYIGLANVCTQG